MGRFYGHFAAAYGTIWFVMMLFAVVTRSQINAGAFGMFGFPVIALVYALVRNAEADPRDEEIRRLEQYVLSLESELTVRDAE